MLLHKKTTLLLHSPIELHSLDRVAPEERPCLTAPAAWSSEAKAACNLQRGLLSKEIASNYVWFVLCCATDAISSRPSDAFATPAPAPPSPRQAPTTFSALNSQATTKASSNQLIHVIDTSFLPLNSFVQGDSWDAFNWTNESESAAGVLKPLVEAAIIYDKSEDAVRSKWAPIVHTAFDSDKGDKKTLCHMFDNFVNQPPPRIPRELWPPRRPPP
ncbi:MAG: hypothetical protein SGPRY_003431 [Prymnesium sp.]